MELADRERFSVFRVDHRVQNSDHVRYSVTTVCIKVRPLSEHVLPTQGFILRSHHLFSFQSDTSDERAFGFRGLSGKEIGVFFRGLTSLSYGTSRNSYSL
jgi:hypothetical protein